MANVLGDESSGSEGGGDGTGKRVVSESRSQPTKAPLVEESEDESEDGPPPAQPQGPVPLVGSRREEDTEMDAAQGILFLSKCLLVFYLSFMLLLFGCLQDPLTFAFVGDLTKDM
jgi:hypothetical protein